MLSGYMMRVLQGSPCNSVLYNQVPCWIDQATQNALSSQVASCGRAPLYLLARSNICGLPTYTSQEKGRPHRCVRRGQWHCKRQSVPGMLAVDH